MPHDKMGPVGYDPDRKPIMPFQPRDPKHTEAFVAALEHIKKCNEVTQGIVDRVKANDPEERTIRDFAAVSRHGCQFVNLIVRADGKEYQFEADWLVRLFRPES